MSDRATNRRHAPVSDRYVFTVAELTRCPKCRSADVRTTRTLSSDAAGITQRKKCCDCLHGFISVVEFEDPD